MKFTRGAQWRWASPRHFFYAGVGGDIAWFHLEIGPLSVMWEKGADATYKLAREGDWLNEQQHDPDCDDGQCLTCFPPEDYPGATEIARRDSLGDIDRYIEGDCCE